MERFYTSIIALLSWFFLSAYWILSSLYNSVINIVKVLLNFSSVTVTISSLLGFTSYIDVFASDAKYKQDTPSALHLPAEAISGGGIYIFDNC